MLLPFHIEAESTTFRIEQLAGLRNEVTSRFGNLLS